MIFKLDTYRTSNNQEGVTLRCPACRQLGTFEAIINEVICISKRRGTKGSPDGILAVPLSSTYYLGHRRCPNPACRAHVFVAWDSDNKVLVAYPPERIDFDSTSIPATIVASFEEAITCHANGAYTAAAIMVRRTLEFLCADKNAKGNNLKERIEALANNVILPPGLLRGLDNLRLLGNDAAHVEATAYAQIGKEEVELAIDVTKEVLKSVYQLDDLVARLERLKTSK